MFLSALRVCQHATASSLGDGPGPAKVAQKLDDGVLNSIALVLAGSHCGSVTVLELLSAKESEGDCAGAAEEKDGGTGGCTQRGRWPQ